MKVLSYETNMFLFNYLWYLYDVANAVLELYRLFNFR